ncbi:hypothetical protein FA95DRAFT_1563720 [Auriscalpium vulgare]|uniref:Uncharacterized protein n=1 Tax=Auriscalpium vulgare TaxID=40419 RepID=A0ACB8RHG1_9AGAM|nr:hypothetical protein FA95DRAFT_1563720 [Auriscalpium vulgare]
MRAILILSAIALAGAVPIPPTGDVARLQRRGTHIVDAAKADRAVDARERAAAERASFIEYALAESESFDEDKRATAIEYGLIAKADDAGWGDGTPV